MVGVAPAIMLLDMLALEIADDPRPRS